MLNAILLFFSTINARDSYRMYAVHGRRGFFSFDRGIRLVWLYTVTHTNTKISFVKSLKLIKKKKQEVPQAAKYIIHTANNTLGNLDRFDNIDRRNRNGIIYTVYLRVCVSQNTINLF